MVKTGQTLKCEICKKEVYVPHYRVKSFKYCDRKCQRAAHEMKDMHLLKCSICQTDFSVPLIRKYRAKYCSRSCYYKAMAKLGSIEVQCKQCDESFKKSPSNDKLFCSRECRNLFERSNNKYTSKTAHGLRNFFKRRGWIKACEICGYSLHLEILAIHHKDRNRGNNDISNLIVLCPNCHSIEHGRPIHNGLRLGALNPSFTPGVRV